MNVRTFHDRLNFTIEIGGEERIDFLNVDQKE